MREPNPTIEDLLVRTADAIWKGGRYQNSEMDLVTRIAGMTDLPEVCRQIFEPPA